MEKRPPDAIDVGSIYYFIEQFMEQEENGATFWKGEDTPGDGVETVFARTDDCDTILGTIDVAEEMEKFASWLRTLTEASD